MFGWWQALVAFFVPMIGLRGAVDGEKTFEHWVISTVSFTVIVHVVSFKLYVESQFWHYISVGAGLVSLVLFHLAIAVCFTNEVANLFHPDGAEAAYYMYYNPKALLLILLLPVVCLIPDLLYLSVTKVFFPSPVDLVKRLQREDNPEISKVLLKPPPDNEDEQTAREERKAPKGKKKRGPKKKRKSKIETYSEKGENEEDLNSYSKRQSLNHVEADETNNVSELQRLE